MAAATSHRKITTYRLSPEMNTGCNDKQPAAAGTLGEKGHCWPSAKVLTFLIIGAMKLLPNQKGRERKG